MLSNLFVLDNMEFDEIADALLREGCMIYGSYVYKRMLLGVRPHDIDAVGRSRLVYAFCGFSVDITKPQDYTSFMAYATFPCFVTQVGLKMKDGNIDFVPATDKVTPDMVDYVVDNISEKKYFPWADMREKDVRFFKDFDIISRVECEANGFPYKRSMSKIKRRY